MINITHEQTAIPIDLEALKKEVQKILNLLEYPDFDIGILLTTDQKIHKLNRDYRGKDRPTDILSFPFYPNLNAGDTIIAETDDEKNLGDIIISPQFVHGDLGRWDMTFAQRMRVLLVHGICHLLGYDHITDDDYAIMKEKEEWLLDQLKGC